MFRPLKSIIVYLTIKSYFFMKSFLLFLNLLLLLSLQAQDQQLEFRYVKTDEKKSIVGIKSVMNSSAFVLNKKTAKENYEMVYEIISKKHEYPEDVILSETPSEEIISEPFSPRVTIHKFISLAAADIASERMFVSYKDIISSSLPKIISQ